MARSGRSVDGPSMREGARVDAPRWQPVVAGLFTLVFGAIVLAWSDITLGSIAVLFTSMMFIQGIMATVASLTLKGVNPMWAVMFTVGVATVVLGAIISGWSDMSALVLMWLVGAWLLFMGTLMLAWGLRHGKEEVPGRAVHVILGGLLTASALYLLLLPDTTALDVAWLLGLLAVIMGVLMVVAGSIPQGRR